MRIKKISEDLSWSIKDGKLYKLFKFKSFKESIDFINQIGQVSEIMNHHPEIRNIYNKVELYIITHDSSEITKKDHILAEKVDKIYDKM